MFASLFMSSVWATSTTVGGLDDEAEGEGEGGNGGGRKGRRGGKGEVERSEVS